MMKKKKNYNLPALVSEVCSDCMFYLNGCNAFCPELKWVAKGKWVVIPRQVNIAKSGEQCLYFLRRVTFE
jgi:hypothetical protein